MASCTESLGAAATELTPVVPWLERPSDSKWYYSCLLAHHLTGDSYGWRGHEKINGYMVYSMPKGLSEQANLLTCKADCSQGFMRGMVASHVGRVGL